MRVALVQDWFVINGGAEKVVREIVSMFPGIEIFSLIDFLNDEDRAFILNGKKVRTSFIQHLPFAKTNYRDYLPFFPTAIESLDFSGFDLVISSSSSVAKGIRKKPGQLHVCYCHTPVRYAWDLEEEYVSRLSQPKRFIARQVLKYIRNWDLKTTVRVDHFLANSQNVSERIRRIYNRGSTVVYPPVDLISFLPEEKKDNYYFTSLRVVPYKKLDLIIEAFNDLPGKQLIVAGDGPDLDKLKEHAGTNIYFAGFVNKNELVGYMQKAKALVLAAEEDFGITSVEAQACCTPVIAYRAGGYLETVVEGKTGTFFNEQTSESLKKAILQFEKMDHRFRKEDFLTNIAKFSTENFRSAFKNCIDEFIKRQDRQS